jgi:hypothetical protein
MSLAASIATRRAWVVANHFEIAEVPADRGAVL